LLVNEAKKYTSNIIVKKGDKKADLKKGVLGLMSLAIKKGEEIEVVFEGDDEEYARNEISKFITENF
ncbi:MAG: HPr family phosphocarrier protein, partial [Lachnospiraceae bacterium]|nr:HPr family phosphocarrier protein [Lachnospiraceae bacterium]